MPQLTRSHGRFDGCEHMTRSPLGRGPNVWVRWGGGHYVGKSIIVMLS